MSVMVALAHSDLIALLPVQWEGFPMTRDNLQTIAIREILPAPAIVLVRQHGLQLTSAADYFCDLLRRHVPSLSAFKPPKLV